MVRFRFFILPLLLSSLCFALEQIETEHFFILFDKGDEYWANKTVEHAEDVWDDLVTAYGDIDDFQKIYIHIKDEGDDANGYAIYMRNKIAIYPTHFDYRSRSSDNWIRNVITHELAHIVTLKAASKDGFFKYAQVGYSTPYATPELNLQGIYTDLLMPMWVIEGYTQFESTRNKGDHWDSFRDMNLRMATLENDLLSYTEMSSFDSRHSFYREMVYNQGFSLVKYLGDTYGDDKVRQIAQKKSYFHFNESMVKALGKTGGTVYREWVDYLKKKYGAVAAEVKEDLREGKMIFDEGFSDMYGVRSPDGRYIALLSNKGYNVGLKNIYILDTKTGKLKKVDKYRMKNEYYSRMQQENGNPLSFKSTHRYNGPLSLHGSADEQNSQQSWTPQVSSRVLWLPDGSGIYYSRETDLSGDKRDIYVYDIKDEKERQLTWHARALDPELSPDGKTFAYINNNNGVENLALVDVDGKNTRMLTNFNNGTQMYTPCWTKDGKKIVIGIMYENNRNLAVVNADAVPFNRIKKMKDTTFYADSLNFQPDLGLTMLLNTEADERDPWISDDGEYLYFSSDRTGIFNVYRMDLESALAQHGTAKADTSRKETSGGSVAIEQITNVLGGAMAPSIDKSGKKLLYTGFHAANFNLYEIDVDNPRQYNVTNTPTYNYSKRFTDPFLFSGEPKNGQYRLGEYKTRFTLWRLDPYISLEPGFISDTIGPTQVNLGINLLTGDVLENFNVFANAYVGKNFNDKAGPSWGTQLNAILKIPRIFAENRDFEVYSEAFFQHHEIRVDDEFEPKFNDCNGKAPNMTLDPLFPPLQTNSSDILLMENKWQDTMTGFAAYVDDMNGSFRYDRKFTFFGAMGFLDFNQYHSLAGIYVRSLDRISGSVLNDEQRLKFKALEINIDTSANELLDVFDISDSLLDTNNNNTTLLYYILNDFDTGLGLGPDQDYIFPTTDLLNYFKNYELYSDNTLMLQYSFSYPRPCTFLPDRVDNLLITTQFVNATYNIYDITEYDTTLTIGGKDVVVNLNADGQPMPWTTSVTETRDFFNLALSNIERFPLPGNKTLLYKNKKGGGFRHFITAETFTGWFNREFNEYGYLAPLKYRVSQFIKGYPYSYTPSKPAYLDVVYFNENDEEVLDSLKYGVETDDAKGDILSGNGIMSLNLEYTAQVLTGLQITPFGMSIDGLYLTPFFATANVWNRSWSDINIREFLPFYANKGGKVVWNDEYLRSCGVRVDLAIHIFDTYDCELSFTWARRLDLGAMQTATFEGDVVTYPKDRYYLSILLN